MASCPSPGVALVTGAAKRIGRAISLDLASRGFDLVVHYGSSADEAEALVARLCDMGVRAVALAANLADPHEASRLFAQARAALGPIRVLVNNAAIIADDRLPSLSIAGFRAHMDTNLLTPLVLSQSLAGQPDLPDGASIVHLIDQRVLKPSPPFFSYGLSKAALWYATRTMAQELAPRIRVNAVGPGPVLPSIHQRPSDFDHEARSTLLGRPVPAEDVAAAVAYLVGSASVTGQMICVDAGQHLVWRTPDMDAL